MRRAKRVDIRATLEQLANADLAVFEQQPTDPASILSHLTAVEHVREIAEAPIPVDITLVDALYAYGMVGVPIQVNRSQSAVVQPW